MSETEQPQRQFAVQRIYTKDISFEAPNAPQVFQQDWSPEINVGLGTNMSRVADNLFELVLNVTVEAKHGDKSLFLVEVHQAGLFAVAGFPEEEMGPLMGIAAPNVLFPYARELVTDLVTRGTFPQFVLQPVNFEALYAQQRQQAAAEQPATDPAPH